jgi:hypothetical protein
MPADVDARMYGLILSEQDENGETPLPSLEYPAPHLVLQKKVEEFARSHMFMINKHVKPTTLQRRGFTRDIYDYARAIGMGRHQADVEVMRARATYRHDRGLTGGLRLDESDDESTIGMEINDAAEYIASMKNGMQRGPVDPAGAWEEITRLQARIIHSGSPTRKRKRDMLHTHTVNGAVVAVEQTTGDANAKASKKHKRRRLKQLHSDGDNQEPAEHANTPPISKRWKRQKRSMRRKFSTLSKPEGVMDVKSEGPSTANISKSASSSQPSAKHIGKAGVEIGRNKPVTAEDEDTIGSRPEGKPKVKNFTANDEGVHSNAGGESWDLRQRKKKKRKRKTVDGSTNKACSLYAKTETELDDSNANINSVQPPTGPPKMDHVQEVGGTTVQHDKEEVEKGTADDSGTAKPLPELLPANSDEKTQGRRDRGKKRKVVNATPKASIVVATEVKDHHS